jgi:hypothetical protein
MAAGSLGAPFLKEEGGQAIVLWNRIDILIPESYFDSQAPLVEDLGGCLETICLFDVRATETETSKPRLFGVRLPARLLLQYGESSTEGEGDEQVRVFTLRAGDVLCKSLSVVQSANNVGEIFRAMVGAKLTGVAYSDFAALFADGAKINGASAGVTRAVLEAVVADMARYPKDINVPLRNALAKSLVKSEDDFTMVKLKDLPRLNGVFSGIGFEDIQLAVQSGVRKTMSGEPQRESPMESILTY